MCAFTRLERWSLIVVQFAVAVELDTDTFYWWLKLASCNLVLIFSEVNFVCAYSWNIWWCFIEVELAVLVEITVAWGVFFAHLNFVWITTVLISMSTCICYFWWFLIKIEIALWLRITSSCCQSFASIHSFFVSILRWFVSAYSWSQIRQFFEV